MLSCVRLLDAEAGHANPAEDAEHRAAGSRVGSDKQIEQIIDPAKHLDLVVDEIIPAR